MVENGEQEQNNQLKNEEATTSDLPAAQNQSTAPSAADTTKHVNNCENGNKASDTINAQAEKSQRKIYIKQKVSEYIKRCIFLAVGLVIMSFGVGLSIQASLGTSPISSVPTVLYYITNLSVGTTTIIFNTLIVVLQIILLRRKFRPVQLLQIPVCIVFGLLCDVALSCLGGVTPQEYWAQWLICIAGIVLVAVGVSFEVAANVITLAGEGLALSLCKLFPKIKFGYMKVMCDCSFVIIAAILSLVFLHKLQGVREGTIAAAIFVGLIAKQLNKITVPVANKLFTLGTKHKNVNASSVKESAKADN